ILGSTFTQPQRAFLVIGLLFGLLMLVLNPPLRVSDEQIHFFKSYSVSEGHIVSEREGKGAGSNAPISFQVTIEKLKLVPFSDYKLKVKDITSALKIPLDKKNKFFANYPHWAIVTYSPVPYIPQAVGMEIGKILNLSPLMLLYLGRLFSLICWLILIYFAIRITPVHKWVFFMLALIPRSVNLAASLSADGLTIALCFLVIAFFLKLAFDKRKQSIERKDIYILILFVILLALMKPPSFLLVFLFPLIPIRKFKSKKDYFAVFALLVVLAIVITGAWYLVGSRGATTRLSTMSVSGQLRFVLSHPIRFLGVTERTIVAFADNWIAGFIDTLGWVEVHLPWWLIATYLFLIIATAAVDNDDIEIPAKKRAYSFVIWLLFFFIFLTIGYLTSTPVGQTSIIEGFQPRYLIPIAPLLFLAFSNQKIHYEKGRYFYIGIVCFSLLSIAITMYKVVSAYYV
ncbi:MAG: DUF2142 domain-containing protein, partial [Actinobacteria bacterium]|nr:DUF2142 domain-containing protein [Actinomycetota bacterium]